MCDVGQGQALNLRPRLSCLPSVTRPAEWELSVTSASCLTAHIRSSSRSRTSPSTASQLTEQKYARRVRMFPLSCGRCSIRLPAQGEK